MAREPEIASAQLQLELQLQLRMESRSRLHFVAALAESYLEFLYRGASAVGIALSWELRFHLIIAIIRILIRSLYVDRDENRSSSLELPRGSQ